MKDIRTSVFEVMDGMKFPMEIIDMIKEYTFPKKIPKEDDRYKMLMTIPMKEYDVTDGVTFVYLCINKEKDYFLTYNRLEIQIQTLLYDEDGHIYGTSADFTSIE